MTFTPANTVAIRSIRFHKWQLGSSVLFLVVLWGTSFPTSQIALRYCPPALFAGLRFALNSVAIGTVALFWREKPQWRTTWWIVCLSTILNVGTLVASTIAIHYLEAGLASLLVYIEPPLAALVAWAYLREKPTTLQAVAIVVGFAGIVVLSFTAERSLKVSIIGLILGFLAGILWSLGTVFIKKYGSSIPSASLISAQFGLGAVATLFVASFYEHWTSLRITPEFIGALIYSAIATGAGWLIWLFLLDNGSVGVTSTYVFLVPVIAVATAAVFLDEKLTLGLVLGGLLVVVSTFLARPGRDASATKPVSTSPDPSTDRRRQRRSPDAPRIGRG